MVYGFTGLDAKLKIWIKFGLGYYRGLLGALELVRLDVQERHHGEGRRQVLDPGSHVRAAVHPSDLGLGLGLGG